MSNTAPEQSIPETYSGPWLRGQLLSQANYIASKDFPDLWKWETTFGTMSKLMVDHRDGESEQVFCRVVGIISEERSFLDAHGTYSPKFDTPMIKSKLQFTLRNPNDDDFKADFNLAYKRLEGIQDKVAKGRDRSWFLMNGTMRFSFALWELKDEWNSGPEETAQTEKYHMRSDYNDMKVETQETHQIRIMRVTRWGSNELLDYSKFASTLPGSLVDVTFVLKHHYIEKDGGSVNSFTASVEQVNILKTAPPAVRSPYQDRRKGGALSISQSPRKPATKVAPSRDEQVSAAENFGPQSSKKADKRKMPDSEGVASTSKKSKEAHQPS